MVETGIHEDAKESNPVTDAKEPNRYILYNYMYIFLVSNIFGSTLSAQMLYCM